MDCILHIGAGKAGSSSVQRFFTENRDFFLENDVLYPLDYLPNGKKGGDNHKSLAFISKVTNWQKPYLKRYRVNNSNDFERLSANVIEHYKQELLHSNCKKLILSGEQFWSELVTEDDIRKLKENLYNIGLNVSKIIFYAREQVGWVNSFLHQKLREGSLVSVTFDIDIDYLCNRLNYFETLSLWGSIFNDTNIVIEKFEKDSFYSNDLLKDFSNKVGIKESVSNSVIKRYNLANNSSNTSTYSIEQCQSVAFFNKKINRTGLYKSGSLPGKYFAEFTKSTNEGNQGFLIPKSKVRLIEELFNYSNKLLFEFYSQGDQSGFLMSNHSLYPDDNVPDFNEKQFYEYLMKIMK